jgi:hypothetical protein
MNTAVITLGTKNILNYSKYIFDINRAYCEKNGYTYIQYNDTLDKNRPVPWSKIIAVKNHLDIFDWIMWIDADAMFFNHDIRIEDRIDDSYNLIIGKSCGDTWIDNQSDDFVNINTGCFLIRGKCSWSHYLLDELYSRDDCLKNKWWENYALMQVFLENNYLINNKIKIIEQELINGYENRLYDYFSYSSEQFILHYAGVSTEEKTFCIEERYKEFKDGKFTGDRKKDRIKFN